MHAFDYHRPTSLADARALYATLEDPMYVSGGMTLIPSMKQRLAAPSDLIDLSSLSELQGIAQLNDAHGATLRVGGLTRHNEVANSALIQQHMPVLGQVAAAIGDNQVRNRGTLGGSIANADPASDLPAALLAMKAVVNTQDRQTPADDFFLDLFETALDAGDIVVSVDFSPPLQAVYEKFRHPASGYAVVGVLVARYADGVRVGVTGAGPCAFRACAMEEALYQEFLPKAVDAVDIPDAGFNSDMHASAEYRAHLIKVLTKRAVQTLLS